MNYKTTQTTKIELTPDDVREILLKYFNMEKNGNVKFEIDSAYNAYDDMYPTNNLTSIIITSTHEENKENDYYNR